LFNLFEMLETMARQTPRLPSPQTPTRLPELIKQLIEDTTKGA
jgi:hypothetical protein